MFAQISQQYACKELIMALLSECQCNATPKRMSIFERLQVAPTKLSKRCRSHRKIVFFDEEYLEVTVNMTGCGRTQLSAPHYDSFKYEPEHDGVYDHIHSHTNQVFPVDYDQVNAEVFGPSEHHSTITESSASNSDEGPPSVNMAGTSEELARQLEAYTRLQAQQQEELTR